MEYTEPERREAAEQMIKSGASKLALQLALNRSRRAVAEARESMLTLQYQCLAAHSEERFGELVTGQVMPLVNQWLELNPAEKERADGPTR